MEAVTLVPKRETRSKQPTEKLLQTPRSSPLRIRSKVVLQESPVRVSKGKRKSETPKRKLKTSSRKIKKGAKRSKSDGKNNETCQDSESEQSGLEESDHEMVQFEEDSNLVDMEAEGLNSEFMSGEEDEDTEANTSETDHGEERDMDSSSDGEVEMTANQNKNAMVARSPRETEIDKEECLINKTVERLQYIMTQGGFMAGGRGKTNLKKSELIVSPSEATVCKTAVRPANRFSSSLEEGAVEIENSSEDIVGESDSSLEKMNLIDSFLAECRVEEQQRTRDVDFIQDRELEWGIDDRTRDRDRPLASGFNREVTRQPPPPTLEQRTDRIISQSEAAKARINQVPGKPVEVVGNEIAQQQDKDNLEQTVARRKIMHSTIVDEGFCLVASHVEESVRRKVEEGEYVDFVKLLPQDRGESDLEGRMELIYKERSAFWVPASNITNGNEINLSGNRHLESFQIYIQGVILIELQSLFNTTI